MKLKHCLSAALLLGSASQVYAAGVVGSVINAQTTVTVTAGGVMSHELKTVREIVKGSDGMIGKDPIAQGNIQLTDKENNHAVLAWTNRAQNCAGDGGGVISSDTSICYVKGSTNPENLLPLRIAFSDGSHDKVDEYIFYRQPGDVDYFVSPLDEPVPNLNADTFVIKLSAAEWAS